MTQRAAPAMTQPSAQSLSTAEFLAALQVQPQRPLEFWLHGERLVGAGYHLTEIGAVSVEAVDCGGTVNRWRETVFQLMDGTPEEAQRGWMTTRKALAIIERVTAKITLDLSAPARFEYGSLTRPALRYGVERLELGPERLTVHLSLPGVQCKAGDVCGLPAGLVVADSGLTVAGSCEQGGGCC
ncbi:DUF6428 family protein [Deinococcus radiophilus]|uniref:Uncharacterized protein n=1 Tax=Deinococcus radiophilus TaxID=32062 RepID=A0A3S0KLP5_9DEIO|nr:DUF6428 family protein [Deinococcus radiophilus]RTR29461.1 hypothetical protein EJ104_03485 [Deinococcus radiophilus]UFA50704.1 DUF6428 family protein [Deinococcus radiophilus]